MKNENVLQTIETLFAFLQGVVPGGYFVKKSDRPKLTAAQAWTVILYVQNLNLKLPDHIERCNVCGEIFDTWTEGSVLDFGKTPYQFCGSCVDGPEYHRKSISRLNPDRKQYLEYGK